MKLWKINRKSDSYLVLAETETHARELTVAFSGFALYLNSEEATCIEVRTDQAGVIFEEYEGANRFDTHRR